VCIPPPPSVCFHLPWNSMLLNIALQRNKRFILKLRQRDACSSCPRLSHHDLRNVAPRCGSVLCGLVSLGWLLLFTLSGMFAHGSRIETLAHSQGTVRTSDDLTLSLLTLFEMFLTRHETSRIQTVHLWLGHVITMLCKRRGDKCNYVTGSL
jgi:hypothetical protein